jgi:hypothetical protein
MGEELCEHFQPTYQGCERIRDCHCKSDYQFRVLNSKNHGVYSHLCYSNGEEPFHLEADGPEEDKVIEEPSPLKGLLLTNAFAKALQDTVYEKAWAR